LRKSKMSAKKNYEFVEVKIKWTII
jgi:hypothetical protein